MSKTAAPDTPTRWPLPPSALLLLAVTAALALAWSHSKLLWFDELIELQTDGVGSAMEVLRIQRHYPLSLDPALFHLVAHASTRLFGVSAFGMRLPALLGFLLAQTCLYSLVKRIAGRSAALVALTLPALSGMFFYAAEARPYGLLYGLDAAVLLAYQAATRRTRARPPVLLALALLLAAAINTHWFGILIAGPLLFAEATRSLQRKRLDWPLLASIAAGLCGLAFALPLYPAVARYGLHYYNDGTVTLHTLTLCYRVLFVSDLQVGTAAQHLVMTAIFCVALAAIAGAARNRRRGTIDLPAHELTLLLATCALPLFGFAVALLVTHTMAIRYVFGAGLGFAALLACALAPWLRGRNARRFLPATLLLALVAIGTIHIRRERLKSAAILARMQLTPAVRQAILAAHAVYLQNVFPFAADHWYTADRSLRNRLTLLYSYDQELRLRGRDTNSLTAENMTHFTGFPFTTYESVRARGGHALFIVTPDPWWDWTLDALHHDGAQLRPSARPSVAKSSMSPFQSGENAGAPCLASDMGWLKPTSGEGKSMTEPEPVPRILALDVGKVRIGVALTDPLGYTAQPLLTLWRKSPGEDMRNLLRLLRRHAVTEIVVGNPLHMNGDVSPWAAKVQAFAADLATRSGLPVHLFDERLTSVEAHALLDANTHARPTTARQQSADRHDRKHLIDQVAAVLILQDWMQARQHAAARQALRANDTP